MPFPPPESPGQLEVVAAPPAPRHSRNTRFSRSDLHNFIAELEKAGVGLEINGTITADPLQILLYIANTGRDPRENEIKSKLELEAEARYREVTAAELAGFLALKDRAALMVALLPYLHPRLAQQQITGADGGPLQAGIAFLELTKDPAAREHLEALSAQMVTAGMAADE